MNDLPAYRRFEAGESLTAAHSEGLRTWTSPGAMLPYLPNLMILRSVTIFLNTRGKEKITVLQNDCIGGRKGDS